MKAIFKNLSYLIKKKYILTLLLTIEFLKFKKLIIANNTTNF